MMNTPLLNNIAFDLVKDKVIQDKLEEAKVEEKSKSSEMTTRPEKEEQFKDEFPDLEEVDSEEERIMK